MTDKIHPMTRTARVSLLLLALAIPEVLAQVYKWVDEAGRVHYGEKPPAGAKSSAVKPPPGAPAKGEDVQAREIEFRQRQVERQMDEDKQAMKEYGSSDSGASLGDILGAAISRARAQQRAGESGEDADESDESEATASDEADEAEAGADEPEDKKPA